jgi:putative copper export protein
MTVALGIGAALARAVVFALIALGIGAFAFRLLVEPRVAGPPVDDARRAAAYGARAAVLLLPALALVFLFQLIAFHDPATPIADDARLLLSLHWGRVWLAQAALALAGAIAHARSSASLPPSGATSGYGSGRLASDAAGLAAVALAFTPALAGHAIAQERWTGFAVAVDGLHVLGTGAWLGTLAVIALLSVPAATGGGGRRLLGRVRAFSPLALASAGVVAATGAAAVLMRFERFSDLWATAYGRWFAAKLVLFACLVAAAAWNWRRATPHLVAEGDPARMRRSIRTELGLALLVLIATALLVASPPPGG